MHCWPGDAISQGLVPVMLLSALCSMLFGLVVESVCHKYSESQRHPQSGPSQLSHNCKQFPHAKQSLYLQVSVCRRRHSYHCISGHPLTPLGRLQLCPGCSGCVSWTDSHCCHREQLQLQEALSHILVWRQAIANGSMHAIYC